MFTSANSPTQAYNLVGVETGVMSASPHKLILMLFDGTLLAIATAKQAMQECRIAQKGEAISRAIDIVTNGLKASLNPEAGGELAERLAALYEYMSDRLLYANIHDDTAALDEVARLLQEIKGAWEEIATDPAVVSANKAAAG